ncbi:hypothetical protein Zm00014a_028773 [Zea mays]|uniref:Uncharacterized protein n=1 Tax=Zea mays TaxID=4577 RepID=A0A3L6F838_MAIZE|nr:hypothetical protein Zm00014a_028773 [Zea mays]
MIHRSQLLLSPLPSSSTARSSIRLHSRRRRQRLWPSHAAVQPPRLSSPHRRRSHRPQKHHAHGRGRGDRPPRHHLLLRLPPASPSLCPRLPSVLPVSILPDRKLHVARQLVSVVYGGSRGALADRGSGGVAAAGEGGVAGVAGGGGVDQLPCSGSASDPSGHAVLRPALSFVGVRYLLLSGSAALNPSPEVASVRPALSRAHGNCCHIRSASPWTPSVTPGDALRPLPTTAREWLERCSCCE